MQDIQNLKLKDLKDYYNTYYHPANAFVVVAGRFQKEGFTKALEKSFGSIPRGKKPVKRRFLEPAQRGERKIHAKRKASMPFLVMGFRVPNLHHPDSYVLEVLSSILGGGKSGRLQKTLVREKALASRIGVDHPLLSVDSGSRRDPDGKEGLARLTAKSLLLGTDQKSANEYLYF